LRRSPRVRLFIICRERGVSAGLSDPPIDQTISVPSDRNLFDIYASPPHSTLRIPHHLGPALLQHDPVSLYRFQGRWHRDARTLPVANLIVVIGTPCEQIPPAPTRSRTIMRFECEQHMPIWRHGERMRHNRLQIICFLRDCSDTISGRVRDSFRRKENIHSKSPLTAFVRTGTLWALLNKALPNPPYCPLPQDRISTFLIAVPSILSTVKNANSPPAFKSMH
jgi:hypothetical protein